MEKDLPDSVVSQKMFIQEIWTTKVIKKYLDHINMTSILGIELPQVKVTRFDRLRWWLEDNVYWRFARHRPDEED